MKFDISSLSGMRVTVMGLGLNGGGYASTRFFASHGAIVTATDLRDEATLLPTIQKLSDLNINYVLGKHEIDDFKNADLVIKNPAVKWDSPYLRASKHIETDISVFLQLNKRPILAVTGSKGKSTTVSALHHILSSQFKDTDLGGNITVSPLTFADHNTNHPVILELSSWQLADLQNKKILDPEVTLITNIMHDHMNHYSSITEYANDKRIIFTHQSPDHYTFCNYDDKYGQAFYTETPARSLYFSKHPLPGNLEGIYLENNKGYLLKNGERKAILSKDLAIPGEHNRINLLCAAGIAAVYGADTQLVIKDASTFTGIPHRMEKVREYNGISYYNDSAATIPQAAIEALHSFNSPINIICGGTDKQCDFTGFAEALKGHNIFLLEGTATDIFISDLVRLKVPYNGPFSTLKSAFQAVQNTVKSGEIVLLSPGATSFGMFLNEFDRGNQYKELVYAL